MYYEHKTKTYFILDDFFFIWVWFFFFVKYKFQNSRLTCTGTSQKIKYLINIIQPNYLSSLF